MPGVISSLDCDVALGIADWIGLEIELLALLWLDVSVPEVDVVLLVKPFVTVK